MDEFKKAYITLGARFENRIRDMFHRVPIYSEYDVTDKRINMIYYPDGFFHFVWIFFGNEDFKFEFRVYRSRRRIASTPGPVMGEMVATESSLEAAVEKCLALECLRGCPAEGYFEPAFEDQGEDDEDENEEE